MEKRYRQFAKDHPRVEFQHPFFAQLPNLYFCKDSREEPVAMVTLGRQEVGLSFGGIRRELGLKDEDADAIMLDLIAVGLDYVKALKPGDPIPKEIITGEASWEPEPRHMAIAQQRLTVQLVSWLSGEEHLITDPDELAQIAEDPQTKKKVNQAFDEIAERLGLGRERREEVVNYIEQLGHELSYIEALRDVFHEVEAVGQKIQGLRKIYGHERSIMETADSVARLMTAAIRQFREQFDQVDAQTGEILAVMKNIAASVAFIRDTRDDLHRRLMAWEDVLAEWREIEVERGQRQPQALRRIYHFLAPRYLQADEWVLMTKLQMRETAKPKEIPLMGEAVNRIKAGGGKMEW